MDCVFTSGQDNCSQLGTEVGHLHAGPKKTKNKSLCKRVQRAELAQNGCSCSCKRGTCNGLGIVWNLVGEEGSEGRVEGAGKEAKKLIDILAKRERERETWSRKQNK